MDERRVAVVTGANAGVGRHTALGLAKLGFHVVLGCRSAERGIEAVEYIKASVEGASAEVMALDLSNLESVSAFTDQLLSKHDKVHALVLNAGIGGMGIVPKPTADDSKDDLMYRVNFVGHFLLVRQLLTTLRKTAERSDGKVRVVCLSSVTHRGGDPSSWASCIRYRPRVSTYSTSKLAMAVFAAELTRRYAEHGVNAIAVNPGAVNSDIWYRSQLSNWQEAIVKPVFSSLFLTSSQGSACSIAAVADPRYETPNPGLYLCPYRTPWRMPMPFELHGPFAGARECRPHPAVLDAAAGQALWDTTSAHLRTWLAKYNAS